jgi:hypothetical protein
MQTMQRSSELSISEVRILSLASIGGALEFYDFVIFVFFANVIGKLFFAASLPDWVRQAQTFGIFAAGYLARPLGGIVMAHFGDTRGRKRMFTLSVLLMAIPTFLIGLLPTYQSIGLAAPLLLLSMRVLQGVAIGGEAPGAWVFVAEHARRGRVGFAVGLLTGGLSFGILLGSLMAACLNRVFSPAEIAAGAWRIPFLVGGVFGFIAMWLRRWLKETPVFEEMRKRATLSRELPLGTVLKNHGRACDPNCQHLDANREHYSCNFDDAFAYTKAIWDRTGSSADGQSRRYCNTMRLYGGYRRCYRSIRHSPCCYPGPTASDGFNLWTIPRSRDYTFRAAATLCAGRSRNWRMCPHTHHDDSRLPSIDRVQRRLILLQPRLCAVRWVDPIIGVMASTS